MLTDAELVDGVVAGYDDAFAQLYERHSLAAWRLGQTVTGNAEDTADAVSEAFARVLVAVRAGHLDNGGSFRSYLLTATRNAALDNIRKTSRARPTEQDVLAEMESSSPSPPERLTGDEEAALVAEAFRNLPERWRSVLWLTEIEGVATKEAAHRLGLSPNGAAQLAVRARAGLRERFLQAHLRKTAEPLCQATVDRLGAYVGGGLAPRDLAKVDQHLAGCASCQARKDELEDVGTLLRRATVPVPLALVGAFGAGAIPVAVSAGGKVAKAVAWAQQGWAQGVAAAAAAGVLAVGGGSAYLAGSGEHRTDRDAQAVVVSAEPTTTAGQASSPETPNSGSSATAEDAPPAPPPPSTSAPEVQASPTAGPGCPGPTSNDRSDPTSADVTSGRATVDDAADRGAGLVLGRVAGRGGGLGGSDEADSDEHAPVGVNLEVALGDLSAAVVLSSQGGASGLGANIGVHRGAPVPGCSGNSAVAADLGLGGSNAELTTTPRSE